MKKIFALLGLLSSIIAVWYLPSYVGEYRDINIPQLTLRISPGEIGNRVLAVPQRSLLRVELSTETLADGSTWQLVVPPSNGSLAFKNHGVIHKKDVMGASFEISFFEFYCTSPGSSFIKLSYGPWSQLKQNSMIIVEVIPST